jgi:hypothetical protein
MSSGIVAGNYTSDVWPKIIRCIEQKNTVAWIKLVFDSPVKRIKAPYFILIDIHGFSKLCHECEERSNKSGGHMEELSEFLRAFFRLMSEYVHYKGGIPIKFVGDAILAVYPNKIGLREVGNQLLSLYRSNFKTTYPETDLAVIMTRPAQCIKGFVGGPGYVDYSYWAPGINNLFKQIKELEEGHVHLIQPDGKVINYDS